MSAKIVFNFHSAKRFGYYVIGKVFIPKKVMLSSQCGNIPFPKWESSSRLGQTILDVLDDF